MDLTGWLADRNPQAALRFVDRLEADVMVLVDQPFLAPVWEGHPHNAVRRLRSGNHLIYYEAHEDKQEIHILTVRHARERPPALTDVGKEE